MAPEISSRKAELVEICREHHVRLLEIFGSAAGSAFHPERSDFDFLVEFDAIPEGAYAANFFDLKEALERLLGRPVDLIVPSAIRNPWFRKGIERDRALLYAA
ncbi:MAG TPA: nucleotidyltransferase domain-containing protein [Acidobacteriaceae bacterium]|nr:nucleotidyltransferase domain-containing protein [Acidobacteriaceae bacterium]